MTLPTDVPFWERDRSGGPITEWQRAREAALEREQDKKLRLLDPRVVTREEYRELVGLKRAPISGRTYQERRALGLCQTCEAPSPKYARCEPCRAEYNKLHPERQRRYMAKKRLESQKRKDPWR